ncbi:MAG TPA: mechanosensitive ion channel family protein [Candidatus Poseidoniaceae archaeon]|jgi:MscS family membrane protein|nr:mechanosensitive ion channel family protein [Candidatus Poseidoniaceae archaeon]
MGSLLQPDADSFWSEQILGLNYLTVSILAGLFLMAVLVRLATMWMAPKLLKKIIRSDSIQSKTVKESDKALGTAAGAGFSLYVLNALIQLHIEDGNDFILPGFIENLLPNLLQFIFAFALVIWAFRLVSIVKDVVELFDKDGELDGSERTLISAVESLLRFLIIALGAVFIADALGFNLTSLIAGLGISGLALALAAKDSISNLFGATTVLLDRPFKVGDWVIIDSVEGEVMEISLRTTLIRTSADTVVTVPNANLVNTPIENFGKRRWRRWQSLLHLDLNSNPDDVAGFCNGVLELIKSSSVTVKHESSWCQVSNLSVQSLDLSLNLYWDVAGGAPEREEKEKFLLGVMQLAQEKNLKFFDARMLQHS